MAFLLDGAGANMRSRILDPSRPFRKFILVDWLGSGAQGEVWKATDPTRGFVALKVLSPSLMMDPRNIERFKAEVLAGTALRHPNAVAIYETGEIEGKHFFTMEWVNGSSLKELTGKEVIDFDRAARFLRDASLAVAALHRCDRLHRDLKPSNILIDQNDQARVTDFGVVLDLARDTTLTSVGVVPGTPRYMSPEQLTGKALDCRSDIFSLGVMLHELLTDDPPFGKGTEADFKRRVCEDDPEPPLSLNSNIPHDLQVICLRCLAKEPARRLQTADALAEELGRYLRRERILARPDSWAFRTKRWLRRNRTLSVSLSLVALAAIPTRRDILAANAFAARGAASSVLLRLREWMPYLQTGAADPKLHSALRAGDPAAARLWLDDWCKGHIPGDSATLLDASGQTVAHCPADAPWPEPDLHYREYNLSAISHDPNDPIHVSAAYRSSVDGRFRFALSTAVRDSGQLLGVLSAARRADASLGIAGLNAEDRQVVVIAPLDPHPSPRDSMPYPQEARGVVIVHPSYTQAPAQPPWTNDWFNGTSHDPNGGDLKPSGDAESPRRSYLDPLSGYSPWLAGSAPLGRTGFVVLVRSRDWFALTGVAGMILGVLAFVATLWRRASLRTRTRLALGPPAS